MNNKKLRNLLKKRKPNSGFTLPELLTGFILSIFVTGALGFGLYQILELTSKEGAKTNARNEASRAIEFISDEMRRASTIDSDLLADLDGDGTEENTAPDYTPTADKKIVLALNIPGLNNSVIYYLKSTNLNNWQGPQVLYRWGPPLDANGNYTAGSWQHEALIDGIDDTTITTDPCNGDTLTPPMASDPSGFYACVNGTNTTAQIYLTGGIDTNTHNNIANDESYTTETRVVARSKTTNVNSSETAAVSPITFRSLEADYICTPDNSATPADETTFWTMRTDFDNSDYDGGGDRPDRDQATTWIHQAGRQAQPIEISSDKDLIINSIPIAATGSNCLNASSGNEGGLASDPLSDFVADNGIDNLDNDSDGYLDTHTVSHTIQFQADNVLNRSDNPDFWKTFNGDTTEDPNDTSNYNNPNVDPSGKVVVLKNGTVLDPNASIDTSSNIASAPLYPGYDLDSDGIADRPSLGRFLFEKGFAQPVATVGSSEYIDFMSKAPQTLPDGTTNTYYNASTYDPNFDPASGYEIVNLEDRERIVAMEIGQTDNGDTVDDGNDGNAHPGFDLQDNVFIMNHDIFNNPD